MLKIRTIIFSGMAACSLSFCSASSAGDVDPLTAVFASPPIPEFRAKNAVNAGIVPNRTYTDQELYKFIGPNSLGVGEVHTQPAFFNGHVFLGGGKADHQFWNIEDPYNPVLVSEMKSPFNGGEAESHQHSFARYAGDVFYLATVSGRGIDIWNVTDVSAPVLVKALQINGINYGDIANAVWGINWQGKYIYVGGTSTGLHIVDATDPANASVVRRLPTSAFGNVLAGTVFAFGDTLIPSARPKTTRASRLSIFPIR